jgi:hypothetical protein
MPRFKIAHIKEQGENMVIIPLNAAFGGKSNSEQQAAIREFQLRSQSAGLTGTVVPVWEINGRMAFIAPINWHPFFKSLPMDFVYRNLNWEIYW